MNSVELRTLCTALGFTAVVLKDGEKQRASAQRALGFADQIEAFCRYAIPSLAAPANENDIVQCDAMIEGLKSDLRTQGSADMEKDRPTLSHLYERLRQRYESYASDDMLADRVLELLDWEIEYNDKPSD